MEKEGNGEKEGEIKGGEEASHDIPREGGGTGTKEGGGRSARICCL